MHDDSLTSQRRRPLQSRAQHSRRLHSQGRLWLVTYDDVGVVSLTPID